MIVFGFVDNIICFWEVKIGCCFKIWEFFIVVKCVEFNEDGIKFFGVIEKCMGYFFNIVVMDINFDVDVEQFDEKVLIIVCDESKVIVVGWSYFSKYIFVGYEDGSVSQYDVKIGDLFDNVVVYEFDNFIVDL